MRTLPPRRASNSRERRDRRALGEVVAGAARLASISRTPRPFPVRRMSKKRVAILISGRGSNMTALIEAAKAEDYPAEIVLVVSNRPEAAGLARARARALQPRSSITHFGEDREAFERALDANFARTGSISSASPDLCGC
jgi:hypothetical protein